MGLRESADFVDRTGRLERARSRLEHTNVYRRNPLDCRHDSEEVDIPRRPAEEQSPAGATPGPKKTGTDQAGNDLADKRMRHEPASGDLGTGGARASGPAGHLQHNAKRVVCFSRELHRKRPKASNFLAFVPRHYGRMESEPPPPMG